MSISPERAQSRYDATKKQLAAAQAKLTDLDHQIGEKVAASRVEVEKWDALNAAFDEAQNKLESFDAALASSGLLEKRAYAQGDYKDALEARDKAQAQDVAGPSEETAATLAAAVAKLNECSAVLASATEAENLELAIRDELNKASADAAKACESQGVIAQVAGQEADELISKLEKQLYDSHSEVNRLNARHNTQKAALAKRITEYPTALASHLRKCTYTGKADIKNRTMNTVKEARKVISDYASASPNENLQARLAASLRGE